MGGVDTNLPLSIRLFGTLEVWVSGRPVRRARFHRSQAVLALLILRQGCELERARLAGLLWPDSAHPSALHSLRNCLTTLRDALGPEAGRLLSPNPRTLSLDLTGAFVDVHAFDAALARGDPEALEEAVSLYRGPLLEGWLEEWAFQERQAREQAYLAARETLAARALARGDAAGAECHLRCAVGADPLRERTQRALMELLATSGNYAAALVAYQDLRLRLYREMNAEPDPETRALFEQIRTEAREKAGVKPTGSSGSRTADGWNDRPFPNSRISLDLPSNQREHGAIRGPAPGSLVAPRSGGGGSPQLPALSPDTASKPTVSPRPFPLQLTSFIGREQELTALQQQLASHRMVTLTGPGGCGKTRLAFEVAKRLVSMDPDGVFFVELAPLVDSALLPQTVATALGIREQPDRLPMETLVEALKPMRVLLLMDNCEHLVESSAQLAEALLQTCPHLRILATSREPLGIGGERTYRVPSLSLPPAEGLPASQVPAPCGLLQFEAIRLFVERAAMAQPLFSLTTENAAVVAQVCCRLDGIPLAIELAAARLKALPVGQLCHRLNKMFDLLTGGNRTTLPRHQTLRALIDWSYDLLTPAEQALLRRLSVFAGGSSLEAAEAVCGDTSVLDLLTRLVDKSLVLYEERAGQAHYRLLEMIRDYARERQAANGETDGLRERHARCFLALAETAEPELAGPDQACWLERLEWEHDNFRAALAWSLETHEAELGLRLASALQGFWRSRGHLQEGRAHLMRLLAEPKAVAPTTARARALSAAGVLTWLLGDLTSARALHEGSLAIWHRLEGRAGIAAELHHLGEMAVDQRDVVTAHPLAEESLALRRALGEPRGLAEALALTAKVRAHEGDPTALALFGESIAIWRALGDRVSLARGLDSLAHARPWDENGLKTARSLFEEMLVTAREAGDKAGIARALTGLADVTWWQDDYPGARALYEQSLPLWRELGDKHGLVETLCHLGIVLTRLGNSVAAYELYGEVLATVREGNWASVNVGGALGLLGNAAGDLGRWEETASCCAECLRLTCAGANSQDRINIALGIMGLARVALARGRPARAARLLAATEAPWGGPVHPTWPHTLAREASAVRAEMEAADFAAAWAEGQAAPLDQIIAEALEEGPAG